MFAFVKCCATEYPGSLEHKKEKRTIHWAKSLALILKGWDCLLFSRFVEGKEPSKEHVGTSPDFPRSRIQSSLLKACPHPQQTWKNLQHLLVQRAPSQGQSSLGSFPLPYPHLLTEMQVLDKHFEHISSFIPHFSHGREGELSSVGVGFNPRGSVIFSAASTSSTVASSLQSHIFNHSSLCSPLQSDSLQALIFNFNAPFL